MSMVKGRGGPKACLRSGYDKSRRSTRLGGWRADPEVQSWRASSEDGRAEHEVHDNVEDEDRGVDAPCPHGATTQDGTDIPLMKDKLAGAMVL